MLASTSSAAAATTTINTRTNTRARCARRRDFSSDVQHHQRKGNTNNSELRRQRQRKRRNNGDNALFVTHADANFGGDTITNNGLTREISEDVDTVLLTAMRSYGTETSWFEPKKAVDYLRETLQKRVFFVTNNATKTREYYQWKFSELGMEVDVNHIYTAAFASASYLSAIGFNNTHGSTTTKDGSSSSNKKIYVVGEQGLVRELEECDVGDIVGGVYEAVVYFSDWEDARVDEVRENDHDDDSRVARLSLVKTRRLRSQS